MHFSRGKFYVVFYRATHLAPSAKRGIAIVSRPSVRLSVRLSVCDIDLLWAYRLD